MDTPFHGYLAVGEKIYAADLSSKSWKHDWHNLRQSTQSALTADPLAPLPKIILGDSRGLKYSIEKVIERFGVKPACKTSVVAAELLYTVSSEYFGGVGIANWDVGKVRRWKAAVLKKIRKVFKKRVAAIIYHADESAPHIHVYVVPVTKHVKRATWNPNSRKRRYEVGQVKLGGRTFFSRGNLVKWQDEYGLAINPLGLLRGRRKSEATHKKMRETQRDLEISRDILKKDRKSLQESLSAAKLLISDNKKIARKNLEETVEMENRRARLDVKEARIEQEALKLAHQNEVLESTRAQLEIERSKLRSIPVVKVARELGFAESENGELQATLPSPSGTGVDFKYRALIKDDAFRVERFDYIDAGKFEWKKQGSGKGAIDFLKALMPPQSIPEICEQLATMFPDGMAGIVCELLERKNSSLWKALSSKSQAPQVATESPNATIATKP